MKNVPSISICSVIARSCDDKTKQQSSPTRNQTSIRTFFEKAAKTNKRPASAITNISTARCSYDISKTLSPLPKVAEDCNKRQNKCSTIAFPQPVNISSENCSDRALHDSTKSYMNTDRRSKLTPAISSTKGLIQERKPQQQLYIDFGQRNFAATNICPICGMLYVHGVQSDIKQHEKVCQNYQYGVLWSLSTSVPRRSMVTEHSNSDRKQQLLHQRICYEWTLPKEIGRAHV